MLEPSAYSQHIPWIRLLARGCLVAIAVAGLSPTASLAQHAEHDAEAPSRPQRQELLVFVSAKYTELRGLESPMLDATDFLPAADVFYSRSSERFRMLVEYLVTDEEHDLERFQIGWQVSENTRFWLGRFHQSASYWNTEHHHGQFLQTPINRPAIEEWEDLGGVLPSHTTGLLLEHQEEIGANAGLQLSLSGGLAGSVVPQQIEPFDLLDPESGHGSSVSLRAAFLPDFFGDDQIGVTYAHRRLAVEDGVSLPVSWGQGVEVIDLTAFGLYADWNWGKWRLAGAANAVETLPEGGLGGPRTKFDASYLQSEYHIDPKWTVFARLEDTSGEKDYLEIFPQYVQRQSLIGARWLFSPKHALSIELSNAEIGSDRFHRVVVQWSAVVP